MASYLGASCNRTLIANQTHSRGIEASLFSRTGPCTGRSDVTHPFGIWTPEPPVNSSLLNSCTITLPVSPDYDSHFSTELWPHQSGSFVSGPCAGRSDGIHHLEPDARAPGERHPPPVRQHQPLGNYRHPSYRPGYRNHCLCYPHNGKWNPGGHPVGCVGTVHCKRDGGPGVAGGYSGAHNRPGEL
jgi:hypothetical protein